MKYTSTRAAVTVSAAEAVVSGVSADGGLFVPSELPKLDYHDMLKLDYVQRAAAVLGAFFDFDVSGIADEAYSQFEDDPAPLVKVDDDLFVLELWHGKTGAYKDMALSVLPRLLQRAKAAVNDDSTTLLLVATSGDTGAAAIEGFKDVSGTAVCAFYPKSGVSAVQELAMKTQTGDNVCVVGVNGNFAAAEAAVKSALENSELISALAEKHIKTSYADSLNIGRIVPQIAYYFSAYCDLVNEGEIRPGETVDFVVPTVGFGNIIAGWYAREMGVPINKLVCAASNNALTEFIKTGVYDDGRELDKSGGLPTGSASNIERLLFELSGRDIELIKSRMEEHRATGRYTATQREMEKIQEAFACGSADDDDIADAIADAFDEYGYLMDPNTAAAYHTAAEREFTHRTVVVSTSDPFKFAPAVLRALGEKQGDAVTADTLEALEELSAMDAPERLKSVFTAEVRFDETIEPADVIGFIQARYGA